MSTFVYSSEVQLHSLAVAQRSTSMRINRLQPRKQSLPRWGGSSVLYHRQQPSTHLVPRATQNVVIVHKPQLHRICSRICTKLLCSLAQKHTTSWHFQVPLEVTAGSLTESAAEQTWQTADLLPGSRGTPAGTPGLGQGLPGTAHPAGGHPANLTLASPCGLISAQGASVLQFLRVCVLGHHFTLTI